MKVDFLYCLLFNNTHTQKKMYCGIMYPISRIGFVSTFLFFSNTCLYCHIGNIGLDKCCFSRNGTWQGRARWHLKCMSMISFLTLTLKWPAVCIWMFLHSYILKKRTLAISYLFATHWHEDWNVQNRFLHAGRHGLLDGNRSIRSCSTRQARNIKSGVSNQLLRPFGDLHGFIEVIRVRANS